MSTTDTPRLRWVNIGTPTKKQWVIRGPIDLIRAAAAAGEAEIVKVQTATVSDSYYDLGDGMGELIQVKPEKPQPSQRLLVVV